MKICFMAPKAYQLFNPKIESTFGGAEVQLSLIAKELAKTKNFDTHFIVADYGQNEIEEYEGIKVWKSLNFDENIIKQILKFIKVLRKINADIYIQRTLTSFSWAIALYCKLKRKKFIYMVANDGETDRTHKQYKKIIQRMLVNALFKFSSLVIVQNQYQKNNLKKIFGINTEIIKSSENVNSNIDISVKNCILWVGRADKTYKRPEIFIKLANCFQDQRFVMIAPPATGQLKYFEEIKNKALRIDNLKFIDFVPFNEIDKYFREVKIFVNTSTQEGFPNTFIQAAKNKTPIVSLNVNPDNFLSEYNCGFCCNNNFDEMNKKLKLLLEDKELYQKMSENVYNYAKVNHDIEKNAKKFSELIKGLK